MAKYDVAYTCGHTGIIQLIGPHSQREWRLERETGRLCPDCYAEELRKQREAENTKAAEAAKEQELPVLTGTEKQVAWAETIRQSFITRLTDAQRLTKDEKFIERSKRFNESVPNDDKMSTVFDYVYAQTSAHWWIDNRRELTDEMYSIWRTIEKFFKLSATVTEAAAEINPAQVESTVRPENPVTETVAEIRVLDKSVEVIFPEKRNDFWQIIKPSLKYEWNDKWQRNCRKPRDYAAQTGNALLSAGFIVRTHDPEIRQQAIDGTFTPENTRVIYARTKGTYPGWLAISWDYKKDDLYDAARKISRSKWDKPYVCVPPEMFAELTDFAEKYQFEITKTAQVIIDVARIAKETALTVAVARRTPEPSIHPDSVPPVLKVPEEVDIDEELRDKN